MTCYALLSFDLHTSPGTRRRFYELLDDKDWIKESEGDDEADESDDDDDDPAEVKTISTVFTKIFFIDNEPKEVKEIAKKEVRSLIESVGINEYAAIIQVGKTRPARLP